jgi:hypothetical protein
MDDCTTAPVVQVSSVIWDISFDPQGNLYGISNRGDLYLIDTITGDANEVHQFSGQQFNSLTIAATGIVYTTGDEGELWTYDPATDEAAFLGTLDFGATGDLTFYRGELYVAADGDRIIRINLDDPSNSDVIINDNIQGSVLGIVSDFVSCHEINVYAITGGLSDIYQIDFASNQLNLICELDLSVYGGASTTEFLSSSSFTISDAMTIDPNCKDEGGQIDIVTAGGTGNITFSIDGSPFVSENSFTSLSAGDYEIIAQDEIGCRDTITVSLDAVAGPGIDTIMTAPSSCHMDNGSFEVFASGGTEPYSFSTDSIAFQPTGVFDNLGSGRYNVLVVDAAGCAVWDEAVVDSLHAAGILSAAVAHTTCNDKNGSMNSWRYRPAIIPSHCKTAMVAPMPFPYTLMQVIFLSWKYASSHQHTVTRKMEQLK